MSDAESPSNDSGGPSLPEPDIEDVEPEESDERGNTVDIEPPNVKDARFPTWTLRKHHKKRKKLAKRGYIRWYLVDGYWPEPKYVQPERRGDGMAVVDHDGEKYLFPRDAMLASEREGMWTVIHKRNESDPINLRDPSKNAIPADAFQEYATMVVQTDAPSLWDKIDISGEEAVMYAIAGIIVFAVLNQVML